MEKIGKIENFVLKKRRKIGKSILFSSIKIDCLHSIRVVIKVTSPKLLRSQHLDQLSRLRKSDQYLNVQFIGSDKL